MRPWAIAIAWLAIVLLAAPSAAPAAEPSAARTLAKASFDRAEQAARERRFAEALAAYREAIAADPSAPFTPVARARAADLEAHAEGDFAPLARLEEVRRDRARSGDRAVIEALERDAASFPPGRVRAEARLLVAEAYWRRLGEPRRAIPPLEAAIEDPAADRTTRSLALSELVTVHRALGDLDGARRAVDRIPDLSPRLRTEVLRLWRRARLRDGSIALLAALGAAGVAALARLAWRARDVRDVPAKVVRPLSVAFSLYLGGMAAVLVRLHGEGDARPFLWLGLGVLALDVTARALRLAWSPDRASVRALRVVACVGGVAAAAFLAIERTDAGYLESFGL
jgi:tetratricopeptide (TPR) repeat protein